MQGIRTKKVSPKEKNTLLVHRVRDDLFPAPSPTSPVALYLSPFTYPVSNPAPDYSLFPPGLLYLDLNIYRETVIKALIKEQSEDLYRLIERVNFDGKYYRVKCVRFGEWKHCWDLAVRVQFIGMMPGLAFEPKKIISREDKKIIYRSLVLVNPYELWEKKLVEKLWNLQDRIEFLIAKILFHECIHTLIFLGKTLPSCFEQTNIFLEFKELLKFANSKKLCPESRGVQFHLRNLVDLCPIFSENSEGKPDLVTELYEFLIHEKYSIKKTDLAFGLPCNNRKISQNYVKLTALKMGPCMEFDKKIWKKEVYRLQKDLEKLYDRIDDNQR
ncbi:hypothetical protein MSBRW_0441 [Methanosarcina barkeri str. Wiesmoor]|uniref:Uncharacterized protein n=2 Tax=Methanosarcina barkeri TaxID=2208 RepID=A0A0E3QI96_METBA|nr:hypothetical protein [Methanosarcina barkeri]AKB49694.1 hypothetical protein MSBRW_0441 [Methanosarcina barkeri str. Wiesmoor]